METAEFLVRNGHEVKVVEMLEDVARDVLPITRNLTLKHLAETGVEILTGTEVTRFEKKRTFAVSDGAEKYLGEFDSVVVAVGTRPVNELEMLLRQERLNVTVIGDAKAPRQIGDAVKEGFQVVAEA